MTVSPTARPDYRLLVDTNCPWSGRAEAVRNAGWMAKYEVYWLEEPVFPPEDFGTLAVLQVPHRTTNKHSHTHTAPSA